MDIFIGVFLLGLDGDTIIDRGSHMGYKKAAKPKKKPKVKK